ncbi:IPT/TIG domain-containing protein, partial [Candidatus Magnetomorum sp. HK-1]
RTSRLLNTFLPAHFKYVMDPSIEAIGQYDPVSGKLNASDQLFFYQSSEYAAIRGSGLDQLTAIYVNNQPAQNVDIVDPETIYFKIPDQTIGQLRISVSNVSDKSDQVESTSLTIMLKSGIRANGIHSFARHDDYLMLLDSSSKKATIYTTRDSENPVKLSSILFQTDIRHMAMSDTYALFVAESNQEIMIYDLSNIYAPVLTNRIVSPIVDDIHKIVLSNETIIASNATTIFRSHVNGSGFQQIQLQTPIQDMAVDQLYIYLLTDETIDVRPIQDWQTIAASLHHNLYSPHYLSISDQRLVAVSESRVELFHSGTIPVLNRLQRIGGHYFDHIIDVAVNGELLAVCHTSEGIRQLSLFDIHFQTSDDMNPVLSKRVSVFDASGYGNFDSLIFQNDLLEWLNGSQYSNVHIPLQNITCVQPLKGISAATERIALNVYGPWDDFKQISLDVRNMFNNSPCTGSTNLISNSLEFQIFGTPYEPDTSYALSLFNAPQSTINGGKIDFDLTWYIQSQKLFGQTSLSIHRLIPSYTTIAQATQYTIMGSALDQVDSVKLNQTTIPQSNIQQIASDGSFLVFSATLLTHGLHDLILTSAIDKKQLHGALLCDEALGISSISSLHPQHPNKVSDSGGTEIIITGTGFNGNIRAYWFKIFQNGIPDYQQLQVNFINTTTFSVISPICQHGQSYQLMIQKTETQENVQSHTLLHGIDDTAPKILSEQPLSYVTPLKLVFSEPVTVDQFSVISEFMTYTGSETTDVSHWFDLFINENTLTLHLKTHMALKHNRAYHIQINGINDLHGNIPVNWETITGGNYASFISGKDTLPPSKLSLIRQLDGQIVNLGMQLTRNKTYTFIPSAIDNMTSANDLAYHVRLSRDGGLTFGDFQIILNQGFNVFIEGTDTNIVFLLKV